MRLYPAALAVLACAVLVQPAVAGPMTPSKQAAVDALSNRLLETIKLAPPTSDEAAYQGQLVAVITQTDVECPIAVRAAQQAENANVPTAARKALGSVVRIASRCGFGATGAVGGAGGVAFASGPALGGGGGGANYH